MTNFHELPSTIRGRIGEEHVVQILHARGWYVIPCYDYSGPNGDRAPIIRGAADGIVLPDLDIARKGLRKWAEVKTKGAPSYTVITGKYEHGIGLRKWKHYRRIEHETGCHVWLFILELSSQLLLVESLDVLGEGRFYHGDLMDPGGMMFWPREEFRTRIQFAEIPGLFDASIPLPFECA